MTNMKLKAHRWLALLAALLLAYQAPGAETNGSPSAKNSSARPDELFSQPTVLHLKVEVFPANLEALKKNPKVYVKGTLREGDRIYPNVGIRLKGNSGFGVQEKKPSLTVKFNHFNSSRLFHGHAKILLDNAHRDPTCLAAAIGGEIFRAAGVPAPRVTFARVEFNGRDAGLYVVEQAANRDFLSEYFKKTKGNLYEGPHKDVNELLEKDSGDTSSDQADLKKLVEASREPDPAQRLKKLAGVLDVDRFISFAAVEVLTWRQSGYAMARNNFRIYHDPTTDRMVFIPHSLSQLFASPNGSLYPEWKGLVAKAVLDNPEGQRLYRERMTALLGGAVKVGTLQARVNELADKLRTVIPRDTAEAKNFDGAVAALRERILQRAYFIEQELRKPAK